MAVTTAKVQVTGLARKLVMDGLLTEEAAAKAWEEAIASKVPFVSHVVSNRMVSATAVAQVAADEFGVPVLDINSIEIDNDVTKLVQEKLVRENHALPIYKRGNRLFIAVSDPTNLQALDEIKFATRAQTEAILVEDDKLVNAIADMREAEALRTVRDGLEAGEDPLGILASCRDAMAVVGSRFERGEYFLPELVMAGEILAQIADMVKPSLQADAPVGADRSGRVAIDWGVYGVPETYVITGDGKIAYKYVGPLTEAVIRDKLLPLIENKAATPQG